MTQRAVVPHRYRTRLDGLPTAAAGLLKEHCSRWIVGAERWLSLLRNRGD